MNKRTLKSLQATVLATAALGAVIAPRAALGDDLRKAAAASDAPAAPTPGDVGTAGGERVNVDLIKQKYWARGDESEIGVVQNRLYSKEHKFEFGLIGNTIEASPFLSIRGLGATFGFHFSEYLSIRGVGWKAYTKDSEAYVRFQQEKEGIVPTNRPSSFFGLEGMYSPIYGKLSLVGKKIIYYDMHLFTGAGVTKTQVGTLFTPAIGIGQQIYITRWMSLLLDYRVQYYKQTPLETQGPRAGQPAASGPENVWAHGINLGVTFLFGGPKAPVDEADAQPAAPAASAAPAAPAPEQVKSSQPESEKKNGKKHK